MATTQLPNGPHAFSLKSPRLADGKLTTYLAQSELLSLAVKIYASGGENKMHMHPEEDHAFVVLDGQATFHINSDENVVVVNKMEGVILPKGTCYWFLSSAPENLVLIRIGATKSVPEVWRAFPDGQPFDEKTIKSRRGKPATLVPGEFFGG